MGTHKLSIYFSPNSRATSGNVWLPSLCFGIVAGAAVKLFFIPLVLYSSAVAAVMATMCSLDYARVTYSGNLTQEIRKMPFDFYAPFTGGAIGVSWFLRRQGYRRVLRFR